MDSLEKVREEADRTYKIPDSRHANRTFCVCNQDTMQSAALNSLNKQPTMLRALSKLPRTRLASRSGLRNATTSARRGQEGERAAGDQGALQQQQPTGGAPATRYTPSTLSPFSLTREFAPLLPSRVSSLFRCGSCFRTKKSIL